MPVSQLTRIVLPLTIVLLVSSCHERSLAQPRAPGSAGSAKQTVSASKQQNTSASASTQAPGRPSSYPLPQLLAALQPQMIPVLRRQLGRTEVGDLDFYDLDLALDGGTELAGRCVLHYLNRTGRELSALPLLLHANAPRELGAPSSSALVQVTGVRALDGRGVTMQRVRLTVTELRFARPMGPGERIQLEVKFTGKLRQLPASTNDVLGQSLASLGVSGTGAGSSDYGLLAAGDGIVTVASAHPMVAPFHNGAFDVGRPSRFGDLAWNELCNIRARISVPAGYSVATNLRRLGGTERAQSGAVIHVAAGAANRDLVIVTGRDLRQLSQLEDGIRVVSTFKPGDEKAGQLALRTGIESLRLYQKRYGPYPFTELDVAQATLAGGAGGVEFPGMVLIAGMLYRPPSKSGSPLAMLLRMVGSLGGMLGGLSGLSGLSRDEDSKSNPKRQPSELPQGLQEMDELIRRMLVFTVAHEVAHQYFAGLVGADCRTDAAFDEPLAQFAATEYAKVAFGPALGERLAESNVKLNYGVYRLLGGKDLPAAQPVRAFHTPLAYAAIVYGKAPYFYPALRKRVGAARFDQALRASMDQHRFRMVTLDEWLRTLDRAVGGGTEPLARRWFRETHGDEDLGVDESGDAVLASLLGRPVLEQMKQSLAALGMHPRDLFRTLMGSLLQETGAAGDTGGSALDALRELEQLAQ